MKRLCFLLLFFSASVCLMAQDDTWENNDNRTVKPLVLPGKGNINVETLNKRIDLKMDISKLNLCELRVLRNAFAARQGYLFNSAELRGVFNTTSWYERLCYERYDNEENASPVKYTAAETAFINKLKAREDELLKTNLHPAKGMVNMDNLVNPYQLDFMPDALRSALNQRGFGILETDHEQLFQVYESNDYQVFPSFVTTDLYLQLYHLFFDTLLRRVEENGLSQMMTDLTQSMYDEMKQVAATTKNADVRKAAEWNVAYFAIARSLFTGQPLPADLPAEWAEMSRDEVNAAINSENTMSPFQDLPNVEFPYSLFRPRGHYTRSEQCGRYFRGMMWLQTVAFVTDKPWQMLRAAVIAEALGKGSQAVRDAYKRVDEVVTYLMGAPDNVTIPQVYQVMCDQGVTALNLAKDKKAMKKFSDTVDQLAEKQIRIRPKFERSGRNKVNLMPQRYQPDAEVLLEMCDYENNPTKRDVPSGLDVMAAMGSKSAENILLQELGEAKRWDQFVPNLNSMKKMMQAVDWHKAVAIRWLDALNTLNISKDDRYPYFMKTPAWDKKNLNATLASWAELKHDAILYAKQPMAAECGGGGLPDPVLKGYVEPNVAFWKKALELLDETKAVFSRSGLLDDDFLAICEPIHDEAEFLLHVSEKELKGVDLTDEEYNHIRYIGAAFENISLELVKEPNQFLMGWDDVQGTDKSIAVVADVYTANGFNNPEQSVLFEGVGPANEIYVVVEMGGYLFLTRGAVFSYREFKRPVDEQRMTDEEWQEYLKTYPETGKPVWMKEIIVPVDKKPVPNERVFYSTGC